MKIWILVTGEEEGLWPRRCGAAEFAEAVRRAAEEPPRSREERKLSAEGWEVLIAPSPAARRTAELCVEGGSRLEEPLLSPVTERPYREDGERPLWLWRLMALVQRRRGDPRQGESRKALAARAEELFARLAEEEKDRILIADRLLAGELMDRARIHGCDLARTGMFAPSPWERILITRRDQHCGGCRHNCLLSNPGCGVGRDKAARKSG